MSSIISLRASGQTLKKMNSERMLMGGGHYCESFSALSLGNNSHRITIVQSKLISSFHQNTPLPTLEPGNHKCQPRKGSRVGGRG